MKSYKIIIFFLCALLVSQATFSDSYKYYDDDDRYHSNKHKKYKPWKLRKIKSAIRENEARITALETNTTKAVSVDCISDSEALKNTILERNTTYILTGMCDGQIVVDGLGEITIQGDSSGTNDDGIFLPAGETDSNQIFAAIYAQSGVKLNLSNLTISAENYNSSSDLYIAAVGSYRSAWVRLNNVDIVGGDEGIGAYNTGTVSINRNVSISNFRSSGLLANGAAVIRVFDSITITGGSSQEGQFSEAVVAVNGGVVRINGSASAITPSTGPSIESASISAFRNGTITVDGGTLNGAIWSGESSAVDLRNVTQSDGNLDAYRNSVLRIRNSNVTGANADQIFSGNFSTLRLDSTSVGNTSGAGSMDTYRYGVLDIRGTSDLNGRDINCADQRELNIQNTVTNVGALSC